MARQVGKDTPLTSIELCGEPGGAVSYKTPNVGLPLEGNPRKVFTTMFGPGDSNAQRRQLLADTGSLLDYVRDASQSLNSELLGASDYEALVSDYLDSVRDVEGRVQKLTAKADGLGQLPDAPLGAPEDFTELLDVQFEMMALAWQTNQTRVATMRMTGRSEHAHLPQRRCRRGLPPSSRTTARIRPSRTAWRASRPMEVERLARFHEARLASIKEGDGNLLDNSIILYGSNMANSDLHNPESDTAASARQGRRH